MTIKVTYNVTDVYMTQSVSPVYITVSYSDGTSGGLAVWGGITGTLSNQTDLQNALNAKVPYSGATGNVDLGEYELKAGQVEFDQTPTGTAGVGVMRWNDTDGTVDVGLKGGNVTLQVGQEQVLRVVNKTGADLLESQYRAVRIRLVSEGGAQGQRLAVVLAQGNNDPDSTTTIGIVTENIANNQEGFITTSGEVRGINTTGSLQGETWADGDIIYLSPTVAGGITKVKPIAPDHMLVLGYVVYAHAVNGKIFVKVDNGYELGELHDVYNPIKNNNDSIYWNSANSRYESNSITGILGYTPVPTTRNITINGVTYDLSADRTWTIAAGISGSGASGQVTYWTGASAVSGDNGLTWDAVNKRLGINTSGQSRTINTYHPTGAPGFNLWAGGGGQSTIFSSGSQGSYNTSYGVEALLSLTTGAANTAIGYNALRANTSGGVIVAIGADALLSNTTGGGNIAIGYRAGYGTGTNANTTGANNIFIGDRVVGVSATANNRTFIGNTDTTSTWLGGNLLLGTTTDGGQRLQVIGDTLLRGSGATSATTALTVQNSSSTNLFRVRNDGTAILSNNLTGALTLEVQNSSTATGTTSSVNVISGSGQIWLAKNTVGTTAYKIIAGGDGYIYNTSQLGDIAILNDYATGQIKFAAGGSSTAHITIKSNGRINMSSLPTSATGLVAGDLWNDAGTVKIV